jgi:hypothetical protein
MPVAMPWAARAERNSSRAGERTAYTLRRAGQVLGVRRNGGYAYPAWQFDDHGRVLDGIPQAIAAARSAGVPDERVAELMQARVGLGGERRLVDSLRDGNVGRALDVVFATLTA